MEAAIATVVPEWGTATLIRPGETESGDRHVVEPFDGGVMVALVDALGHGREAAQVAEMAATILAQNAREMPAQLMRRCHARLRTTRGATISIASFDIRHHVLTWVGVGNVAGVLTSTARGSTSLLVRSGVVGDHLPELTASVIPVTAGTTLVLATDGVRPNFADMLPSGVEPQQLAAQVLDRFATHGDDATVVVFRCQGNI